MRCRFVLFPINENLLHDRSSWDLVTAILVETARATANDTKCSLICFPTNGRVGYNPGRSSTGKGFSRFSIEGQMQFFSLTCRLSCVLIFVGTFSFASKVNGQESVAIHQDAGAWFKHEVTVNGKGEVRFPVVRGNTGNITPKTSVSWAFMADVGFRVRDIFKASGIRLDYSVRDNLPETRTPEQQDLYWFNRYGVWPINIFLADSSPSVVVKGEVHKLNGQMVSPEGTSVDRFNTRREGEDDVIVYINNRNSDEVAATVAHEVGHAFGLYHQDKATSATEIMLPVGTPNRTHFSNQPRQLDKINGTQNSTYHLRQFSGMDESPDTSVPLGAPGTFDNPSLFMKLKFELRSIVDDLLEDGTQIYDINLYSGSGTGDGDGWNHLGNFDLSSLAGRLNEISVGEMISMDASSIAGGERDIVLETLTGESEFVLDSNGMDVVLRQYFADGQSQLFATARIDPTIVPGFVPEPSSLYLCLLGITVVLNRRQRGG